MTVWTSVLWKMNIQLVKQWSEVVKYWNTQIVIWIESEYILARYPGMTTLKTISKSYYNRVTENYISIRGPYQSMVRPCHDYLKDVKDQQDLKDWSRIFYNTELWVITCLVQNRTLAFTDCLGRGILMLMYWQKVYIWISNRVS